MATARAPSRWRSLSRRGLVAERPAGWQRPWPARQFGHAVGLFGGLDVAAERVLDPVGEAAVLTMSQPERVADRVSGGCINVVRDLGPAHGLRLWRGDGRGGRGHGGLRGRGCRCRGAGGMETSEG